jgi:phage terminase large subunit-like protein
MKPDPWQSAVVRSHFQRIMLMCSRQVGKSVTAAAVALRVSLLEAPALVLIVSPSERQSGELMRKVKDFYSALERPRSIAAPVRTLQEVNGEGATLDAAWLSVPAKERESALQLHLKNGSRIIALPASANTVVGYSGVALLIIDEAARVPADLYKAVRPMLAVSRGRLLALSTPFGKRGFFFEEWERSAEAARKGLPAKWHTVRVRATECPRISAEFLADERIALGERWYRQEYETSFEDTIDSVFAHEDIQAALRNDIQPLFGE